MLEVNTACANAHHKLTHGSHKVGETEKKFPEISQLFQSHDYTFPEVIATKIIRNNDLLISRVIPHQLLQLLLV